MGPRIPAKVKPGDPITDELYNVLAEVVERALGLEVATGGPLRMDKGPHGISLTLAVPQGIMARLDGATSPYSWEEVEPVAGGTWATFTGSRTGTGDAYELNGLGGLADKVVRLRRTSVGDWRFQWIGYSTVCNWTITVRGCNNTLLSGATVNLRQSGVLIDSGVTSVSGVVTLNVPAGSYDIEVIAATTGHATHTSTVSHTCSQSTTITLEVDEDHICGPSLCCDNSLPRTLSLTDANGTISLVWDGTISPSGGWIGYNIFTSDVVVDRINPYSGPPVHCDVFTNCDAYFYTSGNVGYVYVLKCEFGTWKLYQYWVKCGCGTSDPPPGCDPPEFRGYDFSGAGPSQPPGSSVAAFLGANVRLWQGPDPTCGPNLQTISEAAIDPECSLFAATFDFPADIALDPVPSGGPVTVSA